MRRLWAQWGWLVLAIVSFGLWAFAMHLIGGIVGPR
jgi:hypothetical protein